MTLGTYFKQSDTPAENSPVGVLMVKVLTKNLRMDFEEVRQEAHRLLDKAAGRYNYVIPRVYSAEEQAVQAERFAALSSSKKAA